MSDVPQYEDLAEWMHSEEGWKGSKRVYLACMRCREKKTRCPGNQPTCTVSDPPGRADPGMRKGRSSVRVAFEAEKEAYSQGN